MEGIWPNSMILSNPYGVTIPQLELVVDDFFYKILIPLFIMSKESQNLKKWLSIIFSSGEIPIQLSYKTFPA